MIESPFPEAAAAEPPERAKPAGTQRERVSVQIFEQPAELALEVARHIADLVRQRREAGKSLVLGLPTGSTPIGVYQQLVRMHREEGLSLDNVVTFNLDEYYPMDPEDLQSYHRFMRENFFDHVDIPSENIHIPRGDIPRAELDDYCVAYEHAIRRAGGMDLILLGIGRSGHIGFNEPGSARDTRTRIIVLDEITLKDAASDFFGEENVPREAITMGVGTILSAREVILMATGEHKAPVVRQAVEDEPSNYVTASYLQLHPSASIYLDAAAAGDLTRERTPWLVRPVEWDPEMSKRAVIWLSEQLPKAIMRLDAADFYNNHLHDLLHAHDGVDELCRDVFEDLRRRVLYRDGLFTKKRVIVFSPHPDDDVISMGGMLDKLVRNENEVTVAYMTNGSVAVFDSDVRRYLRFVGMSPDVFGIEAGAREAIHSRMREIEAFLDRKAPGEVDIEEVQAIKAHIRYAEAMAAIEVMGLDDENARFLDLPFYKTGRVRKDPIGEHDVEIVRNLLQEIRPDHIFVAGDLSDPHGTHRMCYEAIRRALERYRGGSGDGHVNSDRKPPMVWLYRGAWQEWEIHRADVFLPLSKADVDRKIEAIFKHESQKDRAMFPGAYDTREFWQRARDRNVATAEALNNLGLHEFYAAEAFVTVWEMP